MTGDGWDANIRRAIAMIAEVLPSGAETIDMVGWSRGAVTCLRTVSWIREFPGRRLDVNILAVDPAAGLDTGTRLHARAIKLRLPIYVRSLVD